MPRETYLLLLVHSNTKSKTDRHLRPTFFFLSLLLRTTFYNNHTYNYMQIKSNPFFQYRLSKSDRKLIQFQFVSALRVAPGIDAKGLLSHGRSRLR